MTRPALVVGGVVLVVGLFVAAVAVAATRKLAVIDMAPAFTARRPRKSPPRWIVIHHTATESAKSTRAALTGTGKSTHFEVTQAGEVLRYLDPATDVAEHAGWINGYSIGIDVTHRSGAPWPAVQVQAVARLVAELCQQFGIPGVVAPEGHTWDSPAEVPAQYGILRHRCVRPTKCPENFPMEAMANGVRRAVA